jgi:hypothetical protein
MLTAEEVAIHNDRGSCWVIISGQVYDVTDFLDEHPGGASTIVRYAGKVNHPHLGCTAIGDVHLKLSILTRWSST